MCINKKDPSTLSDKEYLKEFAAGPCSPTMILPGLISTKLMVQIDCEELMDKNPKTFSACLWNGCKKTWSNRKKPVSIFELN
jgi:hypothetical protein